MNGEIKKNGNLYCFEEIERLKYNLVIKVGFIGLLISGVIEKGYDDVIMIVVCIFKEDMKVLILD